MTANLTDEPALSQIIEFARTNGGSFELIEGGIKYMGITLEAWRAGRGVRVHSTDTSLYGYGSSPKAALSAYSDVMVLHAERIKARAAQAHKLATMTRAPATSPSACGPCTSRETLPGLPLWPRGCPIRPL